MRDLESLTWAEVTFSSVYFRHIPAHLVFSELSYIGISIQQLMLSSFSHESLITMF
jgi:hypothetical protein